MKLKLIMLVSLFAFGFAMSANAGAVVDGDGDLVPDAFDNCLTLSNGPGESSNQVDSDQDGYGNACDADYDNDALNDVTLLDYGVFLAAFTGGPTTVSDHDGDGDTDLLDFGYFLGQFQLPGFPKVGPSGLACANPGAPPAVCVP